MASTNVPIVPSVSSILIRSDNLETHSLLWVNDLMDSNENRNAQQRLRSIINHIRVFENGTECETYIRQSENDQIILIISEQLGSVIVPLIHSLRQIRSIYVYSLNSSKHQEWTSKFAKIRAIVTDLSELIEKIKMDQKRREKLFDEPLSISISNSVSNEERSSINTNSGCFLHFQLFISSILRLPYNQRSRDEFFNLCKKEYEGNYEELSILREFEEYYTPRKALYWYTRHSFIYRMLNKALRVQDIDVLFLFRFFIRDLYQQLEKLQREQDLTSTRVYRGQLMSNKELDVLKKSKGQLVSMNSFLSTSLDRQKSLSFTLSEHDDLCRVLFEIDADPHLSSQRKPFANISSQSQFVNEQEILFMIGTNFRLIDIREENEISVIQMELCNGIYDHDMKLLLERMERESEDFHECLSLGYILYTSGMHDKAEQFYNEMLNELSNDHPLIADVWGSMGLVKKAKGELEISSQWLNKSFKKYKQMEHSYGVAKCLHNLADIHQMKGEYDQAINTYNQALRKYQELFGDQNIWVASCLRNLGVTYFAQRKFTEAVQCYTDALDIQEIILPHTHYDIGMTLNNIGNVWHDNDEYDRALQYFERALNIFKISLPSEHPSIALISYNMGLIYCRKSDYQQSLIFLNRAASIYHNTLSPDHPNVHRCANTIGYVKKQQSRLE